MIEWSSICYEPMGSRGVEGLCATGLWPGHTLSRDEFSASECPFGFVTLDFW